METSTNTSQQANAMGKVPHEYVSLIPYLKSRVSFTPLGFLPTNSAVFAPPMSEDLRAMILQRFHGAQASQPADEDVFDDIGTGEDVEELFMLSLGDEVRRSGNGDTLSKLPYSRLAASKLNSSSTKCGYEISEFCVILVNP
ncbi:hypothetical protein ACTXT7_009706 [Hymenolepis weldensis]